MSKLKTLKDFTPEIQARIKGYQQRAMEGVLDGQRYRDFDIEKAKAAVYYNYEVCGFKRPLVLWVDNPLEQQIMFNYIRLLLKDNKVLRNQLDSELKQYHNNYLFTLNVYSDCYYTWFLFMHEQFNLPLDPKTEKLFKEIFSLQRESGVYSCIFSEGVAVVCKYPQKVHQVGEDFLLHNTNGNAVEWSHSFMPWNCYYINGRNVSKEIYECAEAISLDDFLKLYNEEDKAAIVTLKKERNGNKAVLDFLGAEMIDEQTIIHTTSTEVQRLYRTKRKFEWANDSKGNSDVQLAWNEMTCPSTGQTYLIETCPTFNSVIESAKWLRPSFVPKSVPYTWQSAN